MYHLWYLAYKRDFVIVMIYVTCVYQYNVLPSFPGCHVGKSTRGFQWGIVQIRLLIETITQIISIINKKELKIEKKVHIF